MKVKWKKTKQKKIIKIEIEIKNKVRWQLRFEKNRNKIKILKTWNMNKKLTLDLIFFFASCLIFFFEKDIIEDEIKIRFTKKKSKKKITKILEKFVFITNFIPAFRKFNFSVLYLNIFSFFSFFFNHYFPFYLASVGLKFFFIFDDL